MLGLSSHHRIALVTGGYGGIGSAVCIELAQQGLAVFLSGRDRETAEDAVQELRDHFRLDVTAVQLDVTDPESIRACAHEVLSHFGHVDVLINNAAVLIGENTGLLQTSVSDFRATFEANFFGALALCQALVPGMVTRGYGRVVNVSSGAGQLSSMTTYAPAYSISKAALNALTIQLAAATRGRGVLVNCVDPGWVKTKMGGPNAPRSVEQGADTIVWLATLPPDGPTGKFFSDRREIAW